MKYGSYINKEDLNTVYGKVLRDIKSHSYVLDVGCYTGELGRVLKKEKKVNIIGIDNDYEAIKRAELTKTYERLHQIDLNNFNITELSCYNNSFDYILLCDVVEHLYAPMDVVAKFKNLLNDNGSIIISLPNISHGGIKLKLLKNRFDYTKTGILDSTHIRFFTLNSFIEFLNTQKISIVKFERILAPLDEAGQSVEISEYPWKILKYIQDSKESFSYQYYAVCKFDQANDDIRKQKNIECINRHYHIDPQYKLSKLKWFKKRIRRALKQASKCVN